MPNKLQAGQTIDVNAAPQPLLLKVPWVGMKVAADLVAGRPFKDWHDLLARCPGLGKGYREAMEGFITFGPDGSNVTLSDTEPEPTEPEDDQAKDEDEDDPEEAPEEPQEAAPKPKTRGKRTKVA